MNRYRWRALTERFPRTHVVVVGDLMLDTYVRGRAVRISPEAPVPVVQVDRAESAPGGAANVAVNAAALGGKVTLCGLLGRDDPGKTLLRALQARNVELRLAHSPLRPTTEKVRVTAAGQQLMRLDYEVVSPLSADEEEQLWEQVQVLIPGCGCVVLSDYRKGVFSGSLAPEIIRRARQYGVPVLADSKAHDYSVFQGVSVVTPNESEARNAVGLAQGPLSEVGRLLLEVTQADAALITLAEDGMALFESGREPLSVRSMFAEVVDVTGAGDTVAGTVALCLASGVALKEAVLWANLAAGLTVRKAGTSAVSAQEVFAALKSRAVFPVSGNKPARESLRCAASRRPGVEWA